MGIDFGNAGLMIPAVLVAVFGVGRLARIITYDDFPPAILARSYWDRLTRDGSWAKLAHCQWCATPWIMAVCLLWGYFSSLNWTWWVFWGWLGIAYLASIVIGRDEQHE